jgi:predicted metal-binding membrane protein
MVRMSEAADRAQRRPEVPLRWLARPETAALLLTAAAAWAATLVLARGMAGMAGTMGLAFAAFVGVWTLMMAAMMLPSVAPTVSLYSRSVVSGRAMRLSGLVVGYLLVWAAAGIPAFGLAWLTNWLAMNRPNAAHVLAVSIFAVCGIYQLTNLKDRCLAHCRSPFGLLLRYGSFRGRTRDLRVGIHHGAYCLGCCWALMVILIAVGVMNIAAMVVLAILILVEKTWARGPLTARLAGIAALGLAIATIWVPALAPGLHVAQPMTMMGS